MLEIIAVPRNKGGESVVKHVWLLEIIQMEKKSRSLAFLNRPPAIFTPP